ncbi:MAG: hypothetical protein KJO41_03975 [Bacteroidia bacterium]|nr:hypothetical protein [Bacteroidia bacterium]
MKHLIVVALIGITLLSCKKENTSCGLAYFGGEIINPNNDHLVLYDSSNPVDTLYLDENNRFFRTIDNLAPGLYSFVHGGEYQVVLLEPNDSIMIRINTYDFDESLVFTGKGSKKNNFLLGLFVKLERENTTMYELGKLEPAVFQKRLDSIKQEKKDKLNSFLEKYPSSPLFNKVANACIDYNYFAQKEIYPFRYFGKHYVDPDVLPEDFYAFRKEVSYDDEDLKDFYPYYNFLFPHFNNLALGKYVDQTNDTIFNRYSVHYNLNKLQLIDSLIKNKSIKNNLLKYSTRNFLSNSSSPPESEAVYSSFMLKSTNKEHTDYITNFFKTLKNLAPGNRFPEIELIDRNKQNISINSLINKKTVVYFWTKANKNHFIESHQKVAELRAKYPDINFISVNVNHQDVSSWTRNLRKNRFNSKHEYMLRNPEVANKILALYNIYKVIVVDENSRIISSNGNMFNTEFNRLLKELSKENL